MTPNAGSASASDHESFNSQQQGFKTGTRDRSDPDFNVNVHGQLNPMPQWERDPEWPPPGSGMGNNRGDNGPGRPPWMMQERGFRDQDHDRDHQNSFDRSGPDGPSRKSPGVSMATSVGLGVGIPMACLVIIFCLYKIWPRRLKNLQKLLKRNSSKTRENHVTVSFDTKAFVSFFHNPQLQDHFFKLSVQPSGLQLSETVLGRGEYGVVNKGFASGLLGHPPRTMVAVKALLYSHDDRHRKSFLNEIETMMRIGRHLNIVNLLGIVVEDDNPKLLLEYCAQGSLRSYLRRQKEHFFYNHVDAFGQLLPHDPEELCNRQNLATATAPADDGSVYAYNSSAAITILSTQDLLSFCYQICRGLEFLASQLVLHRDIAARNVLVTDRKVVKISDFGMARQCQSDIYILESDLDGPMPVKWMAPEAVLQRRFSEQSDVWSFGILTCEIFTLGKDPYPDVAMKGQVMEFITKIRDGLRMSRPVYCPSDIFAKVALRSWNINASERPTFQQLRQILESYIPLPSQTEYLELNQEYETFNHLFGMTTHNAYVDLKYENIIYEVAKY